MKLYWGSRRAWFRYNSRARRRFLKWAMSLKAGDLFGACDGWNHRVATTVPVISRQVGPYSGDRTRELRGREVTEVEITSQEGSPHFAGSGGGCVSYPETPETVQASLYSYYLDPLNESFREKQAELGWWGDLQTLVQGFFRDRYQRGQSLCDPHGCKLPEFSEFLTSIKGS